MMESKGGKSSATVELGTIENLREVSRRRTEDKDRNELVRLGKNPVLKVGYPVS